MQCSPEAGAETLEEHGIAKHSPHPSSFYIHAKGNEYREMSRKLTLYRGTAYKPEH